MRALVFLLLFFAGSSFASTNAGWHEFDVSLNSKQTLKVGRVTLTVERREVRDAPYFKEDYLKVMARLPGERQMEQSFESSYGVGAVAVEGNFLLLKYGIGRGTSARVEHVKAIALTGSREELFDIQTSYYLDSRDHKSVSPDAVDYRLKIDANRDYTTFTFWTTETGRGIPSEKIIKLKNDF